MTRQPVDEAWLWSELQGLHSSNLSTVLDPDLADLETVQDAVEEFYSLYDATDPESGLDGAVPDARRRMPRNHDADRWMPPGVSTSQPIRSGDNDARYPLTSGARNRSWDASNFDGSGRAPHARLHGASPAAVDPSTLALSDLILDDPHSKPPSASSSRRAHEGDAAFWVPLERRRPTANVGTKLRSPASSASTSSSARRRPGCSKSAAPLQSGVGICPGRRKEEANRLRQSPSKPHGGELSDGYRVHDLEDSLSKDVSDRLDGRFDEAAGLNRYLVDNSVLKAVSPGLGYRCSADLRDRAYGHPYAPWGTVVVGYEVDGDWLKTGERHYLPCFLEGERVLRCVDSRFGISGMDQFPRRGDPDTRPYAFTLRATSKQFCAQLEQHESPAYLMPHTPPKSVSPTPAPSTSPPAHDYGIASVASPSPRAGVWQPSPASRVPNYASSQASPAVQFHPAGLSVALEEGELDRLAGWPPQASGAEGHDRIFGWPPNYTPLSMRLPKGSSSPRRQNLVVTQSPQAPPAEATVPLPVPMLAEADAPLVKQNVSVTQTPPSPPGEALVPALVSMPAKADAPVVVYSDDAHAMTAAKPMSLAVKILHCTGLRNADSTIGVGESGPPSCVCRIEKKPSTEIRATALDNTQNPLWNYEGKLIEFVPGDAVEFKVYSSDFGKIDKPLGDFTLQSAQFYPDGFEGDALLLHASNGYQPKLNIKLALLSDEPIETASIPASAKADATIAAESVEERTSGRQERADVRPDDEGISGNPGSSGSSETSFSSESALV